MAGVIITDDNFKEEVLESKIPVLVDFWAPWCSPCLMMEPTIEEISKEFEGKIKVGKMNVDENKYTANLYGIMSIPTTIIFKEGMPIERYIGVKPKEFFVERLNIILHGGK